MQHPSPLFPPCDQCLQRKVRCDKTLPCCYRCSDASSPCTRKVIRRRPGRKKGSGTVISKLRSPNTSERQQWLEGLTSSMHNIDRLHTTGALNLDDGSEIATLGNVEIESSLQNNEFLSGQMGDHQSHDSCVVQSPSTSSICQRTGSRSIGEFQAILSNLPNLSRHIDLFYAKQYPI
jgi:hypothetical protein